MIHSHYHHDYYHHHHHLLFSVALSQLIKIFIPHSIPKSIFKGLLSLSILSEFQSINFYVETFGLLSIPYWHPRRLLEKFSESVYGGGDVLDGTRVRISVKTSVLSLPKVRIGSVIYTAFWFVCAGVHCGKIGSDVSLKTHLYLVPMVWCTVQILCSCYVCN
jgi:hypothetical protein